MHFNRHAVMVRELLSVAKLVTMALRRFPDTFSNAACAAPLKLLRQLWPLFAAESLRCGGSLASA